MYSSTYLCTMATTSARAVHSLMRVPIDWPRTLQLVLFPIRTHPKDRRLEKQPTTTPFIFSYPSFASSPETTITFVLVVFFFLYTLFYTFFLCLHFFPISFSSPRPFIPLFYAQIPSSSSSFVTRRENIIRLEN